MFGLKGHWVGKISSVLGFLDVHAHPSDMHFMHLRPLQLKLSSVIADQLTE